MQSEMEKRRNEKKKKQDAASETKQILRALGKQNRVPPTEPI